MANGLGNNVAYPPPRIERSIRILKYHLHSPPHSSDIFTCFRGAEIYAVKSDLALAGPIQTDNQACHR